VSDSEEPTVTITLPPGSEASVQTIEQQAMHAVLQARDEIAGYRRELLDPDGVLAKLVGQIEGVKAKLDQHDRNERANYEILRRTQMSLRHDYDGLTLRVTALEGRLEAHHDRLDDLERADGRGSPTQPAPPPTDAYPAEAPATKA
jgi:DNA repair exonuclease SbcCD ATPase subunit